MKVGDKILCKKSFYYRYFKFDIGNYYDIVHIDLNVIFVCDGLNKLNFQQIEEYFYTLEELRIIKLNSI